MLLCFEAEFRIDLVVPRTAGMMGSVCPGRQTIVAQHSEKIGHTPEVGRLEVRLRDDVVDGVDTI